MLAQRMLRACWIDGSVKMALTTSTLFPLFLDSNKYTFYFYLITQIMNLTNEQMMFHSVCVELREWVEISTVQRFISNFFFLATVVK